MIITTTENVPGYRIVEIKGVVRGNTVRAKNVVSDFVAGLKNLVGGEIDQYTALLSDAREEAIKRMVAQAQRLGADAVVNVRFTTSSVMQGMAEMLAYGTAVKLEMTN